MKQKAAWWAAMVEEEVNKEKKEEEINKGEKEEERRKELTLEADFTLEPGQVDIWFFLIPTFLLNQYLDK